MKKNMFQTIFDFLEAKAEHDANIYIVIQDGAYGLINNFKMKFPDRVINVGIAEQNAINIASGLALSGKKVYVWNLVPFLIYRPFEQIRLNIAYMEVNVVLIGTGAGYSHGLLGTTHHSIEDIAIMRSMPNMTIKAPGDLNELSLCLEESYNSDSPMYIRIGRASDEIESVNNNIQTNRLSNIIKYGEDASLLVYGSTLHQGVLWVKELEKKGLSIQLISMFSIKPIDQERVLDLVKVQKPIIVLEEHNIIGGLNSAVCEIIAQSGQGVPILSIAIKDEFSHFIGDREYQKESMGLHDLCKVEEYIKSNKK